MTRLDINSYVYFIGQPCVICKIIAHNKNFQNCQSETNIMIIEHLLLRINNSKQVVVH